MIRGMATIPSRLAEGWSRLPHAFSAASRYAARPFGTFADLVGIQARTRPGRAALICGAETKTYGELHDAANSIAAGLQRDGVGPGDIVAICASTSIQYVELILGTLRSGAAFAPLSPSSTSEQLRGMLSDSQAKYLFMDELGSEAFGTLPLTGPRHVLRLERCAPGSVSDWLPAKDIPLAKVKIGPTDPFNIIYSSGTTGAPKGIVQSHAMRWPQLHLVTPPGYGPDAVAIISTPLYSNTTLVSLLPALAGGGTVVLMPRFDAREFLVLSERHRVSAAMLVPVQYRRILDVPDFDAFDLTSYKVKYATSAPFSAGLKAEVLRRWPGGLIEYFGMTEGGGTCMLIAHEHPDKLETVGPPVPGHEMLVIDDQGEMLPVGEIGEIVGRSKAMMSGYHNQPIKSAQAEWRSPAGLRYIRTGDVGRVDTEGFFTLLGRKKDLIISGGINIYPVDLEAMLLSHEAVLDAAVVGALSHRWGETPVAFVTLRPGADISDGQLLTWANGRLGKMQRLTEIRIVSDLPRSPIGKILKRELQADLEASGPFP